jgi:serine/threonine protein kinase
MPEFTGATREFMPPEMLIRKNTITGDYNQSCDIWASGVIGYMLLEGDYPFKGETDFEMYESTS